MRATPQARSSHTSHRILVIDDSPSIHKDFREILTGDCCDGRNSSDDFLFADPEPARQSISFQIDSAYQGREGLDKVEQAVRDRTPYAVCFLDVRMPPGWGGPETLERLWNTAPDLQVVLCTAYSDFSWRDLLARFDRSDRLLFLKKPFEVAEIRQMAHTLAEKWRLARENRARLAELEQRVAERTRDLAAANDQLRQEMQERLRAQSDLDKRERLEALGRMAAGIGHEINNPLSFVAGNIETTREMVAALGDRVPDELRQEMIEALDEALIGSERIAKIVNSISRFARLGDKSPGPFEVARSVALTGEELSAAAPALPPVAEAGSHGATRSDSSGTTT